MAPAPRPITLKVEDYPDADAAMQPVLEKLFQQLNPYFSSMNGVLSSGVSLDQNMHAGLVILKFRTKPTVSDTFPFVQKLPFVGTCVALCPANGRNVSSSGTTFIAAPFAQFEQAGADRIRIINVTGLDSDTDYELSYVAFAG